MDLQQIINAIQSGASQQQVETLTRQYVEENPAFSGDELREAIDKAQLSPDQQDTLLTSLGTAVEGTPGRGQVMGETSTADVIGRLAGGAGIALGASALAGPTALGAAGRALVKSPAISKAVLNWIRSHKAASVGIGGLGFAGAVSAIPEVEQAGQPQAGGPSQINITPSEARGVPLTRQEGEPSPEAISIAQASRVDPGFNVLVIDRDGSLTGVPGQVAIIPPDELGAQSGLSPQTVDEISKTLTFGAGPGPTGSATDVINGVVAKGVSGLQIDQRIQQVISPQTLGQVQINAPVQTLTQPTGILTEGGGGTSDLIGGRPAPGATEGATGPASFQEAERINVPAGASIAPRVFQEHRGRTLLEWAGITAQRHGIPLNVLYGIVDHESNWLPTAVGDNGNSHGLAQIYMPVWGGQVSQAQARDPIFALEWAAQNLKKNFQRFGRWDAAIAAHNSPVAADYLARTGKFQDKKSASYVTDVMSRSNTSGLDTTVFNDSDVAAEIAGGGGGGGGGVSYTPFQRPDPAASREFIQATYQDLLGRKPDEQELERGVARIDALAQQQYQANLRQAKGATSEGVDVEAQFRESITETGEFAFTEETHELDSFTNFASGVARLMQQGL